MYSISPNIFGESGVYQITYKSLSEFEQLRERSNMMSVEWLRKQGYLSHTKHLNEIIKNFTFYSV